MFVSVWCLRVGRTWWQIQTGKKNTTQMTRVRSFLSWIRLKTGWQVWDKWLWRAAGRTVCTELKGTAAEANVNRNSKAPTLLDLLVGKHSLHNFLLDKGGGGNEKNMWTCFCKTEDCCCVCWRRTALLLWAWAERLALIGMNGHGSGHCVAGREVSDCTACVLVCE